MAEELNNIMFDRSKLDRLKSTYKKAVETGKESFIFDNCKFLTSYAKYVIEYLNDKFGIKS